LNEAAALSGQWKKPRKVHVVVCAGRQRNITHANTSGMPSEYTIVAR
jgi:hypothetical protein